MTNRKMRPAVGSLVALFLAGSGCAQGTAKQDERAARSRVLQGALATSGAC